MLLAQTRSATSWYPAWEEVAALLLLAGAYFAVAPRYGAGRRHMACFAGGILLALAAVATPVATVSVHYLVSAHLLQNVVLAEWTPLLLVLGVPQSLGAVIARHGVVRALTQPFVALPIWLATYALWHVPLFYEAALHHRVVLDVEHACYLVAGLLLWWPVFQDEPWRLPSGAKAAYLFAAFILASPLGLILALLPTPLYDTYVQAPRLWGLAPLEDQQLGGTLMAVSEAIVFFGLLAYFFVRFMAEEDAGYSHGDA
ncbi:MAG TPA: cytochrome c oxidase assembly protein [Gaiellaceae bacterium]|nr:cytochrome c oxidase assembly protein [Gaiellaceae bacterium]